MIGVKPVTKTCIESQPPKLLSEYSVKEIKVSLEVLKKNKNVRQNTPVDSNLLLTKYNKEKMP
jgi:hypothetical protein